MFILQLIVLTHTHISICLLLEKKKKWEESSSKKGIFRGSKRQSNNQGSRTFIWIELLKPATSDHEEIPDASIILSEVNSLAITTSNQ